MSDDTHQDPEADSHDSHRGGSVLRRRLLTGLLIVGVLIAALWTASGTLGDRACIACHGTVSGARADTGSHEGVRCYACHRSRTIDGFLGSKAREVVMLGAALAGRDASGTDSTPSRGSCLGCHEEVLMRTVEVGGLRIDHGTCAAVPQACSDCHSGGLHGADPRPGRGIAMDRCLECHDDITAPWACATCHLDSGHAARPSVGSWAVTHGKAWESAHGMGDMKTCGACHPETKCQKCHGIPLPHPAGYVNGSHGSEARPDRSTCLECHGAGFCDDCHGIEMPHDERFLPDHPVSVKEAGDAVCERCHVLADCNLCHVSHTHPGALSRDD